MSIYLKERIAETYQDIEKSDILLKQKMVKIKIFHRFQNMRLKGKWQSGKVF